MIKQLPIILFIAASTLLAGEGSVYSRYGIGELMINSRGKNTGMGSAGVGILSETFINFANPASTAVISRTLFSAAYQFKNYSSQDAAGTSILHMGNINEFGLALPIYSPKKMVLTLGILPYSTIGYDQRIETLTFGIPVTQQIEGHGGLNSAQLNLTYSPVNNLYVGATAHYLFGAFYRDITFHFSSSGFYSGSYNNTMALDGFGVTLGGIYSGIEKLLDLSSTGKLNAGITFFTGSSMDYDNETIRNFSSHTDTITVNDLTVNLPIGFSFGLSYLDKGVLYAADAVFQNWDNFKVAGIHPSEINNSIFLGAGIEFLQSNNMGDSFWERASYRLGGYYHKTNLTLNGTSINEMFATGGIGFPLSFDSRINLGLEYGIRGTTSSLLIKDTIIRFTISLTASETMFIPPPID